MSYVIYNITTTVILRMPWTKKDSFATKGAAKAALNRAIKEWNSVCQPEVAGNPADFAIAEYQDFKKFEKTEVRYGIGPSTGKEFIVPVNTPWTSGPWSETYWSS